MTTERHLFEDVLVTKRRAAWENVAQRASGNLRIALDADIESGILELERMKEQMPECWQEYRRLQQEADSVRFLNDSTAYDDILKRLCQNPVFQVYDALETNLHILNLTIKAAQELGHPFDPKPENLDQKLKDLCELI